jgi:hypothetical protein
VIILGVVLCLLGWLIPALWFLLWVGLVLVVVGAVLMLVPIGGHRRRWY